MSTLLDTDGCLPTPDTTLFVHSLWTVARSLSLVDGCDLTELTIAVAMTLKTCRRRRGGVR